MSKKTLVIGASINPERYSYKAIHKLKLFGHEVIPIGLKQGEVADLLIQTNLIPQENIDTVTLYVSEKNQQNYIDYIINLKPNRVIFNPGTENIEFENQLSKHGIEALEACTLVLLATGQY